jgi:hypothetical protein
MLIVIKAADNRLCQENSLNTAPLAPLPPPRIAKLYPQVSSRGVHNRRRRSVG